VVFELLENFLGFVCVDHTTSAWGGTPTDSGGLRGWWGFLLLIYTGHFELKTRFIDILRLFPVTYGFT
jgi:hypothetical protein